MTDLFFFKKISKIVLFSLILLLFISVFFISGCVITGDYINVYGSNKFNPDQECVLSLCDCQCYEQGFTPEEKDNKICGNDCYGIYHIEKCVMTERGCEIEYKKNVVLFRNN